MKKILCFALLVGVLSFSSLGHGAATYDATGTWSYTGNITGMTASNSLWLYVPVNGSIDVVQTISEPYDTFLVSGMFYGHIEGTEYIFEGPEVQIDIYGTGHYYELSSYDISLSLISANSANGSVYAVFSGDYYTLSEDQVATWYYDSNMAGNTVNGNLTAARTATPLPAAAALLGPGLGALFAIRQRIKRKK